MQTISKPAVIAGPFARDGLKNDIPENPTGTYLASVQEGFPEITMLPIKLGGTPPDGKDFNGAFNLMSQFYFAFQNGWWPTFESTVSEKIGGYPEGAILWYTPTGTNRMVPLKSLTGNNTFNFNTNPEYIGQYWAHVLGTPGGLMSIGTVYGSQSNLAEDNPGALPLNGAFFATGKVQYPDFYSWLQRHTELCTTKADYESRISTYGECPFYVIDENAPGNIRMPILINYVKWATTEISQENAGLPNITGGGIVTTDGTNSNDGAITIVNGGGRGSFSSNYNIRGQLSFDASRSSKIYGASDDVRPAHTRLFPWVMAYNAAVPASVAQAGEFTQGLLSKVDLVAGVSQSDVDYVVDTLLPTEENNFTWYRKYKSGWIEQGSRVPPRSTGNPTSVTLPVPMADGTYSLIITPVAPGAINGAAVTGLINGLGTTTFSINLTFGGGGQAGESFNWCILGKAADMTPSLPGFEN